MSEDVIKLTKKNEVYFHIECDYGILHEMQDHFSFFVEGYKYMAKFKQGVWDGKIRLVNLAKREIYIGLLDEIEKFCTSRNYTLELRSSAYYGMPNEKAGVTMEQIEEFVKSLNIHSKGVKLEIWDYQIDAIYEAINNYRKLILSPTASGKSVIQYCIIRWFLKEKARCLMIVPSIQLIHQMIGDFNDYSSNNGFKTEENLQYIKGGREKLNSDNIVISTWQSLTKLSSNWFNVFDGVLVDEAHGAQAKELTSILEKCLDVKNRLGFTGTIGKSKTNKMILEGLFGSVVQVASTRELIDRGILADIDIKCVCLVHGAETKKLLSKNTEYQREIDFICSHEKRNKFIVNLALSLEGNTLILYNYIEKHGDILDKLLKEKVGDRPYFYLNGKVEGEERDSVRAQIENSSNSITLASLGVFSTGTNVRKINNIIYAHPFKAHIKILQSIGRGLRLAVGKTKFNLFDVSDKIFTSKSRSNYTYEHFMQRLKVYTEEEFNYKIVEVPID